MKALITSNYSLLAGVIGDEAVIGIKSFELEPKGRVLKVVLLSYESRFSSKSISFKGGDATVRIK